MANEAESRVISRLCDEKIVAVVRLKSEVACIPVAQALFEGGVHAIEMTMTTPGAERLIERVRRELPDAFVGAGSVLTRRQVDACIDAGARFLVSPVLDLDLLEYALGRGIAFCPGTLTPSEAFAAWQAGARLIKIFPAARVGPKMISDIKAPMPFLSLMPTGGISAETASAFLDAGADVMGAGSWLTPGDAIAAGEFDVVKERATLLRSSVFTWEQERARKVVRS